MFSRPGISRGFIDTANGKKEVVVIQSAQILQAAASRAPNTSGVAKSIVKTEADTNDLQYDVEAPAPPMAYTQITVSSVNGKMANLANALPPMRTPSGAIKRPLQHYDFSANVRKFPRSADKSKGLRHFSTKVCEKVREKGVTNYNEVADELVQEYFEEMPITSSSQEKQIYDQKNIRRRVYDALNVLMAMNIITKEKKEIKWLGLPTSSVQECMKLEEEKTQRLERMRQKAEQLKDLVVQLASTKALVERNKLLEATQGKPLPHTTLALPYVIVTTDKRTEVDCSISQDKTEYLFKFNQPFEIQEDSEILKRLGLSCGLETGCVHAENAAKLKSYLPLALRHYVDQIRSGDLMEKFIPSGSQSRRSTSFLSRTFDRYEDKSKSLDAADMEVAFTLSKNDRSSQNPQHQHSYYAPSRHLPSHLQQKVDFGPASSSGLHSATFRGSSGASSSRLIIDGSRSAPFHKSADRDEEEEDYDDEEEDFTDFESVGSNSNQGY